MGGLFFTQPSTESRVVELETLAIEMGQLAAIEKPATMQEPTVATISSGQWGRNPS
jgi:hypothetical protein